MTMDSARTVWAEDMGIPEQFVELLTEIAEESQRRAGDARPELDPRDVWGSWPVELDAAGQSDLAERVRAIAAATS